MIIALFFGDVKRDFVNYFVLHTEKVRAKANDPDRQRVLSGLILYYGVNMLFLVGVVGVKVVFLV